MDELEALNLLLRLIGSSPVNSLGIAHPDAVNARATLDRLRRRAQQRGWWFNIDYNVGYIADPQGIVRIPKEISQIIFQDKNLVVRDNKLYNKCTQTAIFSSTQYATRTVRILEWSDMPNTMKDFCAYSAGAEFIRDELEDPSKKADLMKDAAIALQEVKREDLQTGQYNVFQNQHVQRARSGVQPYERNNRYFTGTPDA